MVKGEENSDDLIERLTKKALTRTYKIRPTGRPNSTLEVSIPREVVEREARLRGVPVEDAIEKLVGKWHFNNFKGLYLTLEFEEEEG